MGPRLSSGIEVLHHLDQHLAAVEQSALRGGTRQPPQRLVLWCMQGHGARVEADACLEKGCAHLAIWGTDNVTERIADGQSTCPRLLNCGSGSSSMTST